MENSFQTSFIPKKPITSSSVKTNRPPTSILTVIAFLILIIVGGSSAGLFFYKNYLTKQKEVLSASLEKVRDSFEKDTITELELYDKRVSASQRILNSHIVLSPMFKLLGTLTLPAIQYTNFSHTSLNQKFSVKMAGIALDYRSIALQADAFNTAKGRYFKNVVFSNLVKDKGSNVAFNVEFDVDPALLSYEKNMALEQIEAKTQAENANQAPVQTTGEPSTTIPTTTPSDAVTPTPDQAITPTPDTAPVNNNTQ